MQNNQEQGSIQVQPSILNQNQPQSTSENYPKENSSPPSSFQYQYPFIPSPNQSDPEQHINQMQNNNINVNMENNNINQINFGNNTKNNETEKNKK